MEELLSKYEHKLVAQGLCDPDTPLLGGLDAALSWNRDDRLQPVFGEVISQLNINSILFAPPAEPYFTMMQILTRDGDTLNPSDCETRTLLHDIPVVREMRALPIAEALKKRKCAILPHHGIVAYGTVSPEQAFIVFSSVCFAIYVKFFVDYFEATKTEASTSIPKQRIRAAAEQYRKVLSAAPSFVPASMGPFQTSKAVIEAVIEGGKATVQAQMVDSFFGNISYKLDNTVFISQTGSSLDELAGCIDACPMDGSSCVGLTASSEYTTHRQVLQEDKYSSILHGHPKFCVIRSMMCDEADCPDRGSCHIRCRTPRFVKDVPIVPGEVGTGKYGLCNTVPPAFAVNDPSKQVNGVIVYSHGLFTTGDTDFIAPYKNLIGIEKTCFEEYMQFVE